MRPVLFGTLIGLAGWLSTSNTLAQAPRPDWVYAHDLKVRRGGDTDWDKAAKVGIEFFKDKNTGAVLALTQAGNLAVAPSAEIGSNKKAEWLFAHDLRSRKADEDKFTKDTTRYGVEVFKDIASGKLLYLTERATITFASVPGSLATDKNPAWHHGLLLKVRGPSEQDFTPTTKKFGVEAFKDANTGELIYISEVGALATAAAPAKAPEADKVKAPKPLYGLTLRARKADEPDFTQDTKKYGVEVFLDENTSTLIYISEVGSIATAPGTGEIKAGQGVEWKHAMSLKARPGGVAEFSKANKYGIECFVDKNTGNAVYISETGAIAVLPKK
jgi:predicted small secreted protein